MTTVIASLCDDSRSDRLKRACESVRAMAGDLPYSITVVVNGNRASAAVLSWLAARSDTHVLRLRWGAHPLARRIGAEMADSELVGFLDDDDELLPNTLEKKLAYFRAHPEVDVLVSDGLRVDGSEVSRVLPPPEVRSADLVETMMNSGWGACALTLRTQKVDLAALDPNLRHMEWTLTALTLARHYQVGLLDEPTYRYYGDTPGSLSKGTEHSLAAPHVWCRLSRLYADTPHDKAVRRRYGLECHNASSKYVDLGRLREAWKMHVRSLRSPGGLPAYLAYSRKLLLASLRRTLS